MSRLELLSVDSVSVSYGAVRALSEVSLSVRRGEVVSLVGANGAGKSTLLKAVMGLVRVNRGRITLRGTEIAGDKPHQIAAKGVSFVPEGRRLFPAMTLEENLSVAAPGGCGDVEGRIGEVLSLFPSLAERRTSLAGRLSGGEQQMAAIGRAIMRKPELLLVDEPTLGLAPAVCRTVLGSLEDLAGDGTAVLMAEQSVGPALAVSDRGYVFENGRVAASGPSRELEGSPAVRAAYLGAVV